MSLPGRPKGEYRSPQGEGCLIDATAAPLRPISGFEATAFAWRGDDIVWTGEHGSIDHPRQARRPWQAPPLVCDPPRLRAGAQQCLALIGPQFSIPPRGLLAWLTGLALEFPWQGAVPRFDTLRHALARKDLPAFEAAAIRVLGLGPGLTPSGDDLLGGVFFILAHSPRQAWVKALPAVHAKLRVECATATNVISAALLSDLMDGCGYRVLHDFVAALDGGQAPDIRAAAAALLRLGASSGADLMAGVLLALAPQSSPHRPA